MLGTFIPSFAHLHVFSYTSGMDTLALDTALWDFDVDAYGTWRTVGDATPQRDSTGPGMRLAQDVATRCLAWRGEVYYDATQGVQYPQILGAAPNMAVVNNAYNTEALKVPGCVQAIANLQFGGARSRQVTGDVTVTDFAGNTGAVAL